MVLDEQTKARRSDYYREGWAFSSTLHAVSKTVFIRLTAAILPRFDPLIRLKIGEHSIFLREVHQILVSNVFG